MSDYSFYAAFMRFVASRTDQSDGEVAAHMAHLSRLAGEVENTGALSSEPSELKTCARALAGLAGFLQQHILPEAVAAGNKAGEAQIRWVIDVSMEAVAHFTTTAELGAGEEIVTFDLPQPPS